MTVIRDCTLVSTGSFLGIFQQLPDHMGFFLTQGFLLQLFRVIAVQNIIFEVIVGNVFKRQLRDRGPLFQHVQPLLQGLLKGIEATGQAASVDGHDKAHGSPLVLGGIVIARRDVILHVIIEHPLCRAESNEQVGHVPGGDPGGQLACLMIAPEQFPRMPGDQHPRRAIGSHESQRVAAFPGLQHFQGMVDLSRRAFSTLLAMILR